jgi:hypothetical protein
LSAAMVLPRLSSCQLCCAAPLPITSSTWFT